MPGRESYADKSDYDFTQWREDRAAAFQPISATSQISAVQMLVSLSRASREVRLYADSKAVLGEAAIRPGQGASGIELIDRESNMALRSGMMLACLGMQG